MKGIILLIILLFSIYTPSISQIDGFESLSINKHYFPNSKDTVSISVIVKSSNKNTNHIRCKAAFASGSYKLQQEFMQNYYEQEFILEQKIDSNLYRFNLVTPINLFRSGRYSIQILATDDNWQSIESYTSTHTDVPPISIGKLGIIQGYSNLSVSDDTVKFAFKDFNNNLDISSNKLEGIYTQGFCNNEFVSFNDFNFHIWKDLYLGDIEFSLFYSIDNANEKKLSDFIISDESSDGNLLFNGNILKYPFYLNEDIEDLTISIYDKIYDLINQIVLSDGEFHNLSFHFTLKAGNYTYRFPTEGKLSYNFKVFDLPTGADCQAALLPIDLLKWETHLNKKIVYFEWTTVSEVNNNFFDIQKSNNISDWKTIASIKGNGTTNSTNNYRASDKFPYAGLNYYRLRQSDFDGNFKYSRVKSVHVFDNKISLYPNPVSDYLYYSISDYTKTFKIEIFDNQGKLITDINLPLNSGNKNRIDIKNLKKGTYFLKYYNLENHRVQIHTFIKI